MKNTRHSTTRTPLALLAAAALLCAGACESTQRADVTVDGERRVITIPAGITVDRNERFLRSVERAHEAFEMSDPAKAELAYKESVDTFSELPAAWNNLGVLQMQRREFITASDSFTLASHLSPSDPRPLYNQALLWDQRGYLKDALHLYMRSIERDRNFLPALRGVIRAKALLNEADSDTLILVKKALMMEKDPRWISWFRRQRVRMEARVAETEESPE